MSVTTEGFAGVKIVQLLEDVGSNWILAEGWWK